MVYTMVSGSRGKGEYTIEAGARVPLWPYTMEAEPWPNVPSSPTDKTLVYGAPAFIIYTMVEAGGQRPAAPGRPFYTGSDRLGRPHKIASLII